MNSSFAQVHIYPERLTDSTQSYLYIGVDNPIRISGIKEPYSVSISGGEGTLTKIEKDRFMARVSSITDHAIISVVKHGAGKINTSREFKVRTIGQATSNWISGNKIKRDTLLKNPFLTVNIPDCYYQLDFQVVSFVATIDHGDSILSFPITGGQFNAAFIRHLKEDKTGTLLTFDNIRVQGPDGRAFKFPGVVLYLSE